MVPSPGDSHPLCPRRGVTCQAVQPQPSQAAGMMVFGLAGRPWAQEALETGEGGLLVLAGMQLECEIGSLAEGSGTNIWTTK